MAEKRPSSPDPSLVDLPSPDEQGFQMVQKKRKKALKTIINVPGPSTPSQTSTPANSSSTLPKFKAIASQGQSSYAAVLALENKHPEAKLHARPNLKGEFIISPKDQHSADLLSNDPSCLLLDPADKITKGMICKVPRYIPIERILQLPNILSASRCTVKKDAATTEETLKVEATFKKFKSKGHTVARCPNCHQSHHAWFRGCPVRLEKIWRIKGITPPPARPQDRQPPPRRPPSQPRIDPRTNLPPPPQTPHPSNQKPRHYIPNPSSFPSLQPPIPKPLPTPPTPKDIPSTPQSIPPTPQVIPPAFASPTTSTPARVEAGTQDRNNHNNQLKICRSRQSQKLPLCMPKLGTHRGVPS
ncbi:proteoglycan 4-like [Macrobrachium nipponense]|uniref:proteoglycan 4-like n=1 Tax=Macrobrachium nipponense TaxID=159736 RepID=UPI0030C7B189